MLHAAPVTAEPGFGPPQERALLQQARGLVRLQLEHYFEERESDDEG